MDKFHADVLGAIGWAGAHTVTRVIYNRLRARGYDFPQRSRSARVHAILRACKEMAACGLLTVREPSRGQMWGFVITAAGRLKLNQQDATHE